MKKAINSVEEAVELYVNNARIHGEASETGNYRKANKAHDIIRKCEKYLYDNNSMILLEKYLNDPANGVRNWVSYDLLPVIPEKAIKVKEDIANGPFGAAKATASTTLELWKKGELTFPYMK